MKNFKNKILSVLLFAFSILIVHDYIVVDTNTSYESSYVQSEKTVVDSTSKIHTQIHLTMDMPLMDSSYMPLALNSKRTFDYSIGDTSYIQSVLQRPPSS